MSVPCGSNATESDPEDRIERAREGEAHDSYEIYRVRRNALATGLTPEKTGCELEEVAPEFWAAENRADLVVFVSGDDRLLDPEREAQERDRQ